MYAHFLEHSKEKSKSFVYNCTTSNTAMFRSNKSKAKKAKFSKRAEPRLTVKESFFMEFADEIDLFSIEGMLPEWTIQYREEILNKIGRNFRKICRKLKDSGLKFYIKYPVEVDGRWKFADIYIPCTKTVVVLLCAKDMMHHPCCMKSDKEQFFADRYRVVSVFPNEAELLLKRLHL